MTTVKTNPKLRTIEKKKIICYMLNSKKDYGKERIIQELLADVLKIIER